MDKSETQRQIGKWRDGSIVDEWMNSKPSKKFYLFHPYLTYSDSNNDRFIRPDGTQSEELTANSEALFLLGAKAFSRLPKTTLVSEFNVYYSTYFQFVDELRNTLTKSYSQGNFTAINHKGNIFQPDFSVGDNGWILNIAWNCFAKLLCNGNDETSSVYREAFLFHVFYEIDNALVEIDLGECAAAASISATEALANAISIESGNKKLQEIRREIAMQGAIARHSRTYEKRQQVIDYWRAHIPPDLSNEKAGEWLHDSFSELSVRKLSEYVAQAKKEAKKIPPTSTA